MNLVIQTIGGCRILPVVALEDAGDAVGLAESLMEGGVPVAEVMFRTAAAEEAIRQMSSVGQMLVGAGTVLSIETVKRAVGAGAKFVVSPGLNLKVVGYCVENGIPVVPGVVTPTEIEAAMGLGLTTVKFFPAENYGGVKTIRALAAPYGNVRFVPTGGVSAANLGEYLAIPEVLAIGGSWLVKRELLGARNWGEVRRLTAEAAAIARAARP